MMIKNTLCITLGMHAHPLTNLLEGNQHTHMHTHICIPEIRILICDSYFKPLEKLKAEFLLYL